MKQDANVIIDNLNEEWQKQAMQDKKKIAFLKEENLQLRKQLEESEKDQEIQEDQEE